MIDFFGDGEGLEEGVNYTIEISDCQTDITEFMPPVDCDNEKRYIFEIN